MGDYVKSTNFASKDALATGNPLKIVKGTEIDTEFNNIATAVATKADLNSPTFIGTPTAPTASAGTNTTQLATTAFVKAAVDAYDSALTVSTSQIENNAVTNDKLAVGAAVANIGFTPANSNATVNLTGDQTVAGTKTFTNGIRFDNGTTQSTGYPGEAYGGVGSFIIGVSTSYLAPNQNTRVAAGTTVAGSSLRVAPSATGGFGGMSQPAFGTGGDNPGLAGTWAACMAFRTTGIGDPYSPSPGAVITLWQRIS